MDVASLINSILADDGYNALSEDTKSKFQQYLHTPPVILNEAGTNTSNGSRNQSEIDFDKLNNSTSIREAKFMELQKEIDLVNDQFKTALKQKHELMLHNETLLKNLHEAEVRERMVKMDDGILHLKIDTLNESLFKCTNKLSNLQSKYHKEISELKPDLDEKEAEILMLKNDVNLLQIKLENQEGTINVMERTIKDLNLEHANEIEQFKEELTNNQSLMNHYKDCFETEVLQINKLTNEIIENKDYVCSLTSSLNSAENKYSQLLDEYKNYKIDKENALFVLTNKLNASEEVVKQLLPIHGDTSNYLIHKGTTFTDIYAIYKETCLNLQSVTEELEKSKDDFRILEQHVMDATPNINKLEMELMESNEKVKTLCENNSKLELLLTDINKKLEFSTTKCDQLFKENAKLSDIEVDLSRQICFLLRNIECNKRFENRNSGIDASPQSIISNNYVTFENIQGLQKQNKTLLEIVRSLSKANDKQEIELISDLKEKIKILEENLEEQTNLVAQQKEQLSKLQSLDVKSTLFESNDAKQKSPIQISVNEEEGEEEEEKEENINYSKCSEENIKFIKHQLTNANITINQLQQKLESNNVARTQLDKHVQGLNNQINELLKKVKTSNIKHSQNVEEVATLQSTISSLEHKNHEVVIELDKIKNQYNNLKKDNDSLYITNMNYSRELRQKTELQKEFEKTLASQLDSLIINWNLTLAYIAETDYDKVKFKEEYKKLTKTLKDTRDNLLLKLEAIEDLSTYKEISRSRTNSLSLCSDERSNFQSVVSKLEHEVKNLKSKLNESDQLKYQLKSELNVTKQLYKSLEENLKKMSEYSSQLENEREIKKNEYSEKDQKLINVMQELSEFNSSQKDIINKLQNQLLEYEQNNCKILKELEISTEHNNELLKKNTEQNNNISKLEEELKKLINDRDKTEKGFNHKLTHYKNKLERLEALELFNITQSAEIDHLKNQKAAMEKSIEEIKEIHKTQLNKLNDEINCLNETVKRWQFENELLSEQYKSITELSNIERLNNSKTSNKDDSLTNNFVQTNGFDKQFTKMANLINILKEEKNTVILDLNEAITECNKLKSDLQYKSKVVDDMETQMKELRQLHSSGSIMDNDHSKILEKIEVCNQIVKKNKILEEEKTLLSDQLKALKELDEKKTAEITAVKDDMSGMQSLIDQKSAEIVSLQKNIARWKERSNVSHSDAEYKQLLNTLEREKGKMTTALDQLKSMKSDKSCLEELLKKLETTHSEEINVAKQEIIKLKARVASNNKTMESFKNSMRTYRQKMADVALEINKIKILARRYKHQSEELTNTLNTERSLWQTKFDELQQGGSKIVIDLDERKKLIEHGKQEQKVESESHVNEVKAKLVEAEAGLSAAKSELEVIKAKREDKDTRTKQILQQARTKIQNLSKEIESIKKQRDGLLSQIDEAENRIQECQVQIAHLDQENHKLVTEKEKIVLEKTLLSDDIKTLNHRVSMLTALMRQFSNPQVKPSTSTGPEKLAVDPPTANIKPLGPAVNKSQPVHHSVTVNPWRSAAAETPLASIKPMTMQTRSVVVLPTSQTSSTSSQSLMSGTSSSTTITVHPQQPQSVDISSSGGNALDSSEANSTAQSRHLTSSTLVQHVEGSESTATVSDSNETTTATPPSILPLQQVIGSAATPSVTAPQTNPAISIALVVPQGREQVQTTVSQPTTVSVSTVSPSQSQIDRYSVQNENGQAMESSSGSSNIASSTAPGPSTESEPSIVTACTSGPSCSSLDTTTHSSNNNQRKRKADLLVTSYMKRTKSFMPREENRREIEYEAPTSSQRDSEVSNSYTGPESNPQDNKEVEASTDMEVTSEATHENNEVDLTTQECTADTNNMNENNDIQNEETEQTTGENTPEHSSSNAEATAMASIEEDAPELIRFQEFQNTPVSSASYEETKSSTDNVSSDAESRQNESDSMPVEPQAGTSSDTMDTVGVSQSTENAETDTLDLEQETVEILSSENEDEVIEVKSTHDIEESENNDSTESPEIISVSSSPGKDNEAIREESPVAGPSGVPSDSSANERKPITWDESP
ncbi:Major intrinsic protein, conserved site [Cinara cedri]|uniref:Major intrinsic protein, conserved site n=1 Tax=Cinara cedri TaxID=506608 RepID=A0A5E4M5N8_9HEMI|nr:Major intrinsic protein, conserved site [Cinara cedri]